MKTNFVSAAAALLLGLVEVALAEPPAKPLPQETIKVWGDAGAKVGWMKDFPPEPTAGYEYWEPFREKGEPGALPAFRYHRAKEGDLAKLPDPGVPFGLDMHCCSMNDAELKELAGLKSLQTLNIGGALLLSDAGLKELAVLKNLQGLYLFYAPVTDAGLKELAALKNLRVLDLSHTQVKGAGLKDLAALKCLQALNVSYTNVTDAALRDLAGMKSLEWLSLDRTKVTAGGVAALQKELPACKIVGEPTADEPPQAARRKYDELVKEIRREALDEIVKRAESQAKSRLPEKVTTAEQALHYAPAEESARKSYQVLEHKGWWVVAYYGGGSEPALWFSGVAIRKDSRDIYHFGSW